MKKALIITLSMLLVAVVGAAFYTLNQHTANDTPRRINLDEGTSYQALCDTLDASPTFRLMAHTLGLDKHVREGSYIVEAHMNELALIRKLRNGQQDPIRLTIGKFRLPQQLNEYLNSKLMHNDFNVTLDSFYLIRPNTYEFYWTVTPERFMARMTDEFNAFWKDKTGNFDYNLKDIIIIASIVEEETNNNAEKPLIPSTPTFTPVCPRRPSAYPPRPASTPSLAPRRPTISTSVPARRWTAPTASPPRWLSTTPMPRATTGPLSGWGSGANC